MTLFNFAIKSIVRKRKDYIYYFFNCLFVVLVYFLFSDLSYHPSMNIIDKNSTMGLILLFGKLILLIFSLFFIIYSTSEFFKVKSKNYGIISIIGASKKQVNIIIFLENMIVGFFSIVVGILLGIIFSKLFLDIAEKIIGNVKFDFYFPTKAILFTIIVMGILFFVISVMIPITINRKQIYDLLKVEKKTEKEPKIKLVILVYFVNLIFFSFVYVVKIISEDTILGAFIAYISLFLFIVLGIYLIYIYSIKIYIFIEYKRKKAFSKLNLIKISNLKSDFSSTAIILTISTILYSTAFISVIVLSSQSKNILAETKMIMPYSFSFVNWNPKNNLDYKVDEIQNILSKEKGYEKSSITFSYFKNESNRFPAMSETEYNKTLKFLNREPINLQKDEVYLVSGNVKQKTNYLQNSIKDKLSKHVKIVGNSEKTIMLSGFFKTLIVLDDSDFHVLEKKDLKESLKVHVFNISNWEKKENLSDEIAKKIEFKDSSKYSFVSAYNHYKTEQLQTDLILYLGSILSFCFILGVASIIYSRLYSQINKECEKMKKIIRIGLSKSELRKINSSLIKMIAVYPYMLSLVLFWTCIYILEKYTILSNTKMALQSTVFLIILEFIIYKLISYSYNKKIETLIYD